MSGLSELGLDPTSYRVVSGPNPWVTEETNQLGRDEFMKLLVAQLENQNPLEPAKDTEFVAQLATFSSLEQLVDLNKRMDAVLGSQQQLVNSQALNLVGREVLANTGGRFRLADDGAETIVVDNPSTMASLKIEIYDGGGRLVRTIDAPPQAGQHEVTWDGLAADGTALATGDYTYRAIGTDGSGVAVPVGSMVRFTIDGLRFGADGLVLVSAGRAVPFADIVEIAREEPASAPVPEPSGSES